MYAASSSDESSADDCPSAEQDTEWAPDKHSDSDQETKSVKPSQVNWNERKLLVFESCILQLFVICTTCLAPVLSVQKTLSGSML